MQLSASNLIHDDMNGSFKKHFNLNRTSSKTSRASLLDDLKTKASQYSKSRTTKTLLNSYSQGLMGGHDDLSSMSNGSSKSMPYMGRFTPSKNDSNYYYSTNIAFKKLTSMPPLPQRN